MKKTIYFRTMKRLLLLVVLSLSFSGPAYAQYMPDDPDLPEIPGVTVPWRKQKVKEQVKTPITLNFVKGWVATAANDIFHFSAGNYPERRATNKDYFTNKGYKSFYGAIESGFLKNISDKKQDVKGYIISPVSAMEPRAVGSTIFWDIGFDYVIEYISETGTSYQFLEVLVEVKDVSDQNGLKIAINRWRSTIDKDPTFCVCRTDGGPKKGDGLGDKLKRQFDIPDEPEEETQKDLPGITVPAEIMDQLFPQGGPAENESAE